MAPIIFNADSDDFVNMTVHIKFGGTVYELRPESVSVDGGKSSPRKAHLYMSGYHYDVPEVDCNIGELE